MPNILIIGATSAIAEATARLYALRGDKLFLLARNADTMEAITTDLSVRGAEAVGSAVLDVTDLEQHEAVLRTATEALGGTIDVALIAHGTLPDQKACEAEVETMLAELNINAISTVVLLTRLANQMEAQKSGTLAVISSVAGDRGRQSNYVYGAAKQMVSTFLQGLRNRLHKAGVNVLDIKPGFVDTPMTAEFKKGALWAKPEDIASDIVKAIDKGKHTLYTPFFWRYIMLIIRSVPEVVFKRLGL